MPRAAIVSLAIGPQVAVEDLEEVYRGLCTRLLEHGARLVGGNVSGLADGLVIDITLLGEVEAGGAVRRDAAQPGDIVWVTGAPGSSAAGLGLLQAHGGARPIAFEAMIDAYLLPAARPREGRALGASGSVSAMIDLSDGLIGDLTHMVEARPIGILLREEALPIGDALCAAAAAIGRTPISLLLGASDDYELIFSTRPEMAEQAMQALRSVSDVAAWPIGEVIAGAPGQVLIEDRSGRRHRCGRAGLGSLRRTLRAACAILPLLGTGRVDGEGTNGRGRMFGGLPAPVRTYGARGARVREGRDDRGAVPEDRHRRASDGDGLCVRCRRR